MVRSALGIRSLVLTIGLFQFETLAARKRDHRAWLIGTTSLRTALFGPNRDSASTFASRNGEKRAMAQLQIVNIDKALCWNSWPEYCCVSRTEG
jgi:hypothetical protein